MNQFSLKVCVCLVLFSQSVISEEYLFTKGRVTWKNVSHDESETKFRVLYNVDSIDHHLLPNVLKIKITETKIPNLYEDAIKNLPYLQKLQLSNCGIETLSPRAFKNIQNLRTLHLQDNEIETIVNDVFNGLPVMNLYLQRNKIKTIESEAFDNMPNLVLIKLNHNQISMWDNKWFKNSPNLSMLYFRKNFINEIPKEAFINLATNNEFDEENDVIDTSIFLSSNVITFIDPEAFEGLQYLNEIWLDRNHISEIDEDTFSSIKKLNVLNLEKNNITEIERNTFKSIKEMSLLNLKRNNLACLPYEVVESVKMIEVDDNDFDCHCLMELTEKLARKNIENTISFDGDCSEN